MDTPTGRRATRAAIASATALGLEAEGALVLQDSNQLTLRLLPCDVLARVVQVPHLEGLRFELEVGRGLAATGSPVEAPDPRVATRAYVHDGFAITFWTYYEAIESGEPPAAEYARALQRLHAGMRELDLPTPHFTDRIAEAQRLAGDPLLSPGLEPADREFLTESLRFLCQSITRRGAPEQVLHGEPHPGNVLRTKDGLRFIDLETCCRGPVEFDIAHAPEAVSAHYPGADQGLLEECRALVLAMVAAWRWDRDDLFPGGRQMGREYLSLLRAALKRARRDAGR